MSVVIKQGQVLHRGCVEAQAADGFSIVVIQQYTAVALRVSDGDAARVDNVRNYCLDQLVTLNLFNRCGDRLPTFDWLDLFDDFRLALWARRQFIFIILSVGYVRRPLKCAIDAIVDEALKRQSYQSFEMLKARLSYDTGVNFPRQQPDEIGVWLAVHLSQVNFHPTDVFHVGGCTSRFVNIK